jgi:hypothetical protein
MESICERVGPDPGGEHWKEEMVMVIKEQWVRDEKLVSMDDPKYEVLSFEGACEEPEYKDEIDIALQNSASLEDGRAMQESGIHTATGSLSLEDAQVLAAFSAFGSILSAATRKARAEYAGLTHRYYNLLVRLADGTPASDVYYFLQDTTTGTKSAGLQDKEPGWEALVTMAVAAVREGGGSQLSGLHSMTSAGATTAFPGDPGLFAPEGFRHRNSQRDGVDKAMEIQDSVIVKFVSAEQDCAGLHTAVFTDTSNCAFPPIDSVHCSRRAARLIRD